MCMWWQSTQLAMATLKQLGHEAAKAVASPPARMKMRAKGYSGSPVGIALAATVHGTGPGRVGPTIVDKTNMRVDGQQQQRPVTMLSRKPQ